VVALKRALDEGERNDAEDSHGLYDDASSLIRYLRARKWDLEAAEAMIRATACWRMEFGHAAIRAGTSADSIARENASGKMYVRGYDLKGRPGMYMKPRNETFTDQMAMMRHLVYVLERAVACMERQTEKGNLRYAPDDPMAGKFVLLIDFADLGYSNMIPWAVALVKTN
jgi:hypothetical protein